MSGDSRKAMARKGPLFGARRLLIGANLLPGAPITLLRPLQNNVLRKRGDCTDKILVVTGVVTGRVSPGVQLQMIFRRKLLAFRDGPNLPRAEGRFVLAIGRCRRLDGKSPGRDELHFA